MTEEERSLLDEVEAAPLDPLPRHVYADWLGESYTRWPEADGQHELANRLADDRLGVAWSITPTDEWLRVGCLGFIFIRPNGGYHSWYTANQRAAIFHLPEGEDPEVWPPCK